MNADTVSTIWLALGSLIASIAAIIIGILTANNTAKKTQVDALVDTAERLEKENARLSQRQDVVERENEEYREWAKLLVEQVISLGGAPIPFYVAKKAVDKRNSFTKGVSGE